MQSVIENPKGQPKLQLLLIQEFKYQLSKKLSSVDAISNSIKSFNLIHSEGLAIGLERCNEPGFDLFDSSGNWNEKAFKIDENELIFDTMGRAITPKLDDMFARVDDILYPNILDEKSQLSDKEKIILCVLIYEIQSQLLNNYVINRVIDTEANISTALYKREMIYHAAHEAVAFILPSLEQSLDRALEETTYDDCKCVMF